jgi:hypothetical protein
MPGAMLFHDQPTYQGTQGQGVRQLAPSISVGGVNWSFALWLALLGVVIPALILHGLKLGSFSFVFRNR